jgi:phosphoribosylformylglycinamidine cyclo-ligase
VGVVGGPPLLGDALCPGDEIVLVASSGLHANGASLARLLAQRLERGYATRLASGRTFGEALLDPSRMYVGLVAELLGAGAPLHYISHITGHGLLKLMRAQRELRYVVERLPEVPEVLRFLAEQTDLDAAAAYSTFNMGAGMALYCAAGAGEEVASAAVRLGHDALVAGAVQEGAREVILEPLGVRYTGDQLELGTSSIST